MSGYSEEAWSLHHSGVGSPLPLPHAGKTPPPRGFTGRDGVDPSSAEVQAWVDAKSQANIACRLAEGVLGLDVDAYEPKNGAASLASLSERLGELPPTVVVTSRDGDSGIRLYRVPAGRSWAENADHLVGRDSHVDVIQRAHRYVVWKGSTHPSGALYRLDDQRTGEAGIEGVKAEELPDLPEPWVVALQHREVDELHDPAPASPNPHEGLIPVGSRDTALRDYAALLRRKGLTEREAEALVRLRWEDCEQPPGDEFSLAAALAKVASAYRNLDPEVVDEAVQSERPTRLTDGASFLLDEAEAVPVLWGDGEEALWAKGECLMIVGPPGAGKTTIAQQLVFARMGLREEVVAWPVGPDPGRVLYLAMDRPSQIRRSMGRLVAPEHRATLGDRLRVHKGPLPVDLTDPRNRDWLADYAESVGATTVVVDSLKDVVVRLSDDSSAGAYNAARMEVLARGIEVVELHHQRKANGENRKPRALDDVFGSRMLTAGAGSVLMLWGQAGDPVVEAFHVKPVLEPLAPFKVHHDHRTGESRIYGQEDLAELLTGSGEFGLTPAQIAMQRHSTTTPSKSQVETARKQLKRLVDRGVAEVVPAVPDRAVRYRMPDLVLDLPKEPDL
ncbi:hypothetical protein GCM10009623_08450 [Nocardioides aestuarii]|uniref:Bifunctional DNA primase/polymerase n=1 Tax=Nocardioides aestuarii TaxID=252231 RepID=A0ABW4TEZ3_9ACTN